MSFETVPEHQNGVEATEKDMAAMSLGNGTNGQTPVARSSTSISLKPPFLNPLDSIKIAPPPPLTEDEQKRYDSLLETVKSWTEIPAKDGKGGPVTDQERMWLTRECLLRYLRATKWSPTEAPKRLLSTLTWRREYGVWEQKGETYSEESETGKQFLLGYDNDGRPCHYMNPGRQNTEVGPKQNQHMVFMVERVIDLTLPGDGMLCLLINFKSGKKTTSSTPSLTQGIEALNILQSHYPDRLGRALVINIPWYVNGFFKLIMPFIDPMTKTKLKFNDDMRQHVPPQQLWTEFEGDLDFEYNHDEYWPALLETCKQRQEEYLERWVKAGKHIGESENYLKGGDASSIAEAPVNEPAHPSNGDIPEPQPQAEAQASVAPQ